MTPDPTVYVVDDDSGARESVRLLVRSMGLRSEVFESAEAFLAAFDPNAPGCLVTDVRMPGLSGLELQETLSCSRATLPVVLITAHAHTALTVQAMQQGAVTLLDKPYRDDELWTAIRRALTIDVSRRHERTEREAVRTRLAHLTRRERDVLERVVEGKPNKLVARELGISERTVENRRRAIYTKTETTSVAELVRLVIDADEEGDPADAPE